MTTIHLALLAPAEKADVSNGHPEQILATTLPAIELAIETIKEQKLLNGIDLVVHYRDTKGSSTIGPLAAFDLIIHQEADVFFGPVHDYVLAPVARYASIWRIPVLTTGGIAGAFDQKVLNFLRVFEPFLLSPFC